MTTQDAIDRLADWLREKTAGLRYQFAPARANSEKTDEERKLVAPVVYAGNFPRRVSRHVEEGEEPEEEPQEAPSIIVTVGRGGAELDTAQGVVTMPMALHIETWSPGEIDEYGEMFPTKESCRDIIALTDEIVKALAVDDVTFPGGLNITGNISYEIDDYFTASRHPYYYATVSFSVSFVRALPSQTYL